MRPCQLLVLGFLLAACTPAKAKVAPPPAPAPATVCGKDDPGVPTYIIDGVPVPCPTAMSMISVSPDRIASVEVLKGAAAVSRYGQSAAAGVIVIHTKQER
jgi:TonB-dependent SusC/RagA subfamily outer membrane receptor